MNQQYDRHASGHHSRLSLHSEKPRHFYPPSISTNQLACSYFAPFFAKSRPFRAAARSASPQAQHPPQRQQPPRPVLAQAPATRTRNARSAGIPSSRARHAPRSAPPTRSLEVRDGPRHISVRPAPHRFRAGRQCHTARPYNVVTPAEAARDRRHSRKLAPNSARSGRQTPMSRPSTGSSVRVVPHNTKMPIQCSNYNARDSGVHAPPPPYVKSFPMRKRWATSHRAPGLQQGR